MPSEPSALTRLTRLLAEIQTETSALDRLHRELTATRHDWPASEKPSRPNLIVAAVDLHGYYTALESLLGRVARAVDQEMPTGPSWHSELLVQMALEIPSLRPAVIPEHVTPDLHELRKFRHFFRNVYVLDPDPSRVLEHVDRVLAVHPAISSTLQAFREHMEQTLEAMASEK